MSETKMGIKDVDMAHLNEMEWNWNGDRPTETEAANDCRVVNYYKNYKNFSQDFDFKCNSVHCHGYGKLPEQQIAVRFLADCLKMIVREHVDPKAVVRMVCHVRELAGLIPDDAREAADLPPMTEEEERDWQAQYFKMCYGKE